MRVVLKLQSFLVGINHDSRAIPKFSEGHFVHGQGASFIGANVISSAHGLTCFHLADQVVVGEHLLDRDCE